MPNYSWPEGAERRRIGRNYSRLDGPAKVSGKAEYTFDVKLYGMLYAKILTCPHGHARVTSIDTAAAENMAGVKAVNVIQGPGTEIHWAGDDIVIVAAVTEEIASDAVKAIKVEWEVLPHYVDGEDLEGAPASNPEPEQTNGDPDKAFAEAAAVSEGYYAMPVISHACLESHGDVAYWEDDEHLVVFASTQAVSSLPGQFAEALGIPAANVRVICQNVGGGFGSKFNADRWGIECARMARQTKRPVKLMLDRDVEQQTAGGRPSAYGKIKVAVDKEGNLTGWESKTWGTGGPQGTGSTPVPYVVDVPNRRHLHHSIPSNHGPSRAWRAPNHPQACFLTMSAIEDVAAKLGMCPVEMLLKNIKLTGARADNYAEELKLGAKLMDWKNKWKPRGTSEGPVKRGLGVSIHTWGGRGHQSNCEVVLHPDGSVEVKLGSQDLGTGTRTVIAIVAAETLGLEIDEITVRIGDSRFPASGPSGGSTTVGGVSSSTRRACLVALEQLAGKVAGELEVDASDLEAVSGRIQSKSSPDKYLTWREATSLLGMTPITANGQNPGPGRLIDSGVAGVQMADVSVDTETGRVKINKMVAVQDCGLVIDVKTAKSQVYGALIMGIAYALTEERVMDPVTGILLNGDLEFYKLPGIGDIGELVVHMMTGPGYDERGVIGLGEPPVVSPGAVISNAVANALGFRVPYLPLTPERVLDAIAKGGVA